MVPAPHSKLYGRFDFIDSLLLKMNWEAGIVPQQVKGVWNLGMAKSAWPVEMEYFYRGMCQPPDNLDFRRVSYYGAGREDNVDEIEYIRSVEISAPQYCVSQQVVVEISGDFGKSDSSADNLFWLSRDRFYSEKFHSWLHQYQVHWLGILFGKQ